VGHLSVCGDKESLHPELAADEEEPVKHRIV